MNATATPSTSPASTEPCPSFTMPTVTPHIVCDGASDAIDFYKRAFGAEELARVPGPGGRLMHAMIVISGSPIMLADENREWGCQGPKTLGGTPVTIHLQVPDADAVFDRAVQAGAKVAMPLADMFWGDRYGQVQDPWGHVWSVATHVRDVPPEELQAAAAKFCQG